MSDDAAERRREVTDLAGRLAVAFLSRADVDAAATLTRPGTVAAAVAALAAAVVDEAGRRAAPGGGG